MVLVIFIILERFMYIADMHSDSLSLVTSERGLATRYNTPYNSPILTFHAAFIARRGEAPEARRHRLMHALDVYISECERLDLVPIYDTRDLNFAIECERSSSIFALEGGGGLFADSEELTLLHRAGLRVFGLAWDTNELATSSTDENDKGLTQEGRALAERLTELGIIIDVSHLSDKSVSDLLTLTPYPVIATHSNFRSVCNTPRNLPDHLAEAITRRGGVIGLSLYPPHLNDSGDATLDDLVKMAEYGIEHFGVDSIGFGFDIDGTEGRYPLGLDESESIHDRVIDHLLNYYDSSVVEKLAGGNVLTFLKNNLN